MNPSARESRNPEAVADLFISLLPLFILWRQKVPEPLRNLFLFVPAEICREENFAPAGIRKEEGFAPAKIRIEDNKSFTACSKTIHTYA